jgi:hypothetical protein
MMSRAAAPEPRGGGQNAWRESKKDDSGDGTNAWCRAGSACEASRVPHIRPAGRSARPTGGWSAVSSLICWTN